MGKQTIRSIYTRSDAMAEAVARWTDGNNAGVGYAIDVAELENAEQILSASNDQEVDVYIVRGDEVAVGDANGAWAVTI